MAEYIERESLLKDIKQYAHARIDNDAIDKMGFQFVEDMVSILRIVEIKSAADVVEVKHGEWIWEETMSLVDPAPIILCCSVCGGCHDVSEYFRYCPHCGAKMKSKRAEDHIPQPIITGQYPVKRYKLKRALDWSDTE